ncbi:MAG: ATP-binding cassette domain-containing protein [bacterium]
MIRIENLKKYYGSFPAVDGITFEVKAGEILGFLGPNGAGKTTTMKVITGYYPPTEGSVNIDGHDVVADSLTTRGLIGYLPESNPLYTELTVREYLQHIAELRQIDKEKRKDRIVEMAELTGLSDRLEQPIHELSKGYRQRVGLAQAMLHDPKILILDEPTIGLDPNQIVEIRSLIKKIGREKTVILSTHILPEVQATCDRVVIIHRGLLVADGTPDELQHKFRGQPVIDLEIRFNGREEKGIKEIGKIAGVASIESLPESDGGTTMLRVITDINSDPREALFKLCVQQKWTLLGMNREIQSLENIFAQLTTGDNQHAEEEAA